jgi:hypothetical protein
LLLRVWVVGLGHVLHFHGLLAWEECERLRRLGRPGEAYHTILRWRRIVIWVGLAVTAAVVVVVLLSRCQRGCLGI